jgi:uncharacterized protein YjeT (DUF2065 family)
VTTESSALAPAATPAADRADLTIEGGWRLELSPEGLRLSKPGEATYQIARDKVLDGIERIGLNFLQPAFVVRAPKRKVFKLAPDQAAVLDAWLGDDFRPELHHQLKHRMGQAIPMGVLYMATGTWSWDSWALGGLLVLEGILFRFRPSHWLFLLETLLMLGLLVRNIGTFVQAVDAGRSPSMLTLFFAFVMLVFIPMSVAMFLRFQARLGKKRSAAPPAQ